jgi:hypothetical protein
MTKPKVDEGNGAQPPEEKAVQDELDELVQLPDAPRLDIPKAAIAQIIGEQYAREARSYWQLRILGEVSLIVGDKPGAQDSFDRAKKTVQRLTALKEVASERGVRKRVDDIVTAWLDEEREKQKQERADAVHEAAHTGEVPEHLRPPGTDLKE